MKALLFVFVMLSLSSKASAAPCSETASGPCMPDHNDENDQKEIDIIQMLDAAKLAEPNVAEALDDYKTVRNDMHIPASARKAVFEEYLRVKNLQDALYEKIINDTAKLYHVRPRHTGRITVGEPDGADDRYMTGLTAVWNPQAAAPGLDGKLAVRIDGNDGPHYMGGTKMDPSQPGGRYAVTLPDGRVLIMKDTFNIAVDVKENLGFLAAIIYHETRHFNKLSWKDKSGKNRSWASDDEEERDAYAAEAKLGKEAFGLSDDDVAAISRQSRDHANAVKTGVPINNFRLNPKEENTWKNHYENVQLDLEEEYAKLRKDVAAAAAEQMKERDRRLAEEIEERERQARETENQRLYDLRIAAYYRQEMRNEAAACGYEFILRSRETDAVMGIRGLQKGHYFASDGILPFGSKDLRIVLLLTRTCDAIKGNYQQDACNDSTPAIRERASTAELKTQLDHILGEPHANKIDAETRNCVDYFISNAEKISDTKSLEKVIVKYRKELAKEKREYDKRWGSGPTSPPARGGGGGGSRPPDGDNNDRIWDPGCGCWIRRQ